MSEGLFLLKALFLGAICFGILVIAIIANEKRKSG